MPSEGGHQVEIRTESEAASVSSRVLRDWFHFVLHPDQKTGDRSLQITIRNFFKLYYFNILALFVICFLVLIAQFFFKLEHIPFPKQSSAKTLIMVAILSVIEEVLFRLPLRFRPFNLALPLGLIATVGTAFFLRKLDIPWPVWTHYLILLLLAVITILLIYFILRHALISNFLYRVYERRFAVIFYVFNITFALLHFSNYRHFNSAAFLIAPIITLPQLLTGLNLSYLRIRHGFFWAALYHVFWNMVWFLMILNNNNPLYGLQLMAGTTVFGLLLAWAIPAEWGRQNTKAPLPSPPNEADAASEPTRE
jgi:hypothetical protein